MPGWLEYAIYSLGVCLTIFIVPGQIFFLSIREGMRGLRNGVLMLMGVLTAEVVLIALLALGFIHIFLEYMTLVNLAGATLLIWLGISAIRSGLRGVEMGEIDDSASRGPYLRGLLLTLLNPPYIIWLITVGAALLGEGLTTIGETAYLIFAASLLGGSALVTMVLVWLAAAGRRPLREKGFRILFLISGSAFLFIAVRLLFLLRV